MKKKKTLPPILINSRGTEVPLELVRPEHLKKHITVEDIFSEVEVLQEKMIVAKKRIIKKVLKYLNYAAKLNGIKNPQWEDVNLSDYPTLNRVVIKTNTSTEFDENLQLARVKIDECLDEWTEGTNPNIKVIIDRAFKVGKKGFINKANIFGLFQLNIEHPKWKQAMDLIQKSITDSQKKEYVMFQKRANNKAEWETIILNFSSLPTDQLVRTKK